jgi:peroxiredoxin
MWRAVLLALLALSPALAGETELCVKPGEALPDLVFEHLLAPEDYETLGLGRREGPVRLSEVEGDLLVLEFFNKYCLTCWRQAPQLEAFSRLLEPGDLGGRVRILSVGAGNSARELEGFRREFGLTYPLAPDPAFEQFYALGEPGGTPCTALLLRRGGEWVLADFHVGFYGDVELLARSRVLLKGWSAPPAGGWSGGASSGAEASAAQVEAFLARVAGTPVRVQPLALRDGTRLWRAAGEDGRPTGLFARAGSRQPICDLCHPVRFLLAFDDDGVLRGFEALYVTKFGNELWSAEDAAHLERRLSGRPLHELPFHPEVDAVTSATMSSALIFDEARRCSAYLRELADAAPRDPRPPRGKGP